MSTGRIVFLLFLLVLLMAAPSSAPMNDPFRRETPTLVPSASERGPHAEQLVLPAAKPGQLRDLQLENFEAYLRAVGKPPELSESPEQRKANAQERVKERVLTSLAEKRKGKASGS